MFATLRAFGAVARIKAGAGAEFFAAEFNGTNALLSAPDSADFDCGSGNYCIEAIINTSDAVYSPIISQMNYSGTSVVWNNSNFQLRLNPDIANFRVSNGSTGTTLTSTTACNNGAYHHLAAVRDGSTLRLYVDGTQEDTDTAVTQQSSSSILRIGTSESSSGLWLDGYVKAIAFHKATVYPDGTGFTAPESGADFTNDSNTILLLDMTEFTDGGSETPIDSSNGGTTHTITNTNVIGGNP